jgi:hypothetical protein
MHIIGQVYNPEFTEKVGEKGPQFKFTLGHRRAFVQEGESTMLFTRCVAYNSLAPVLAKHFGNKEEHHGKWIALGGHMDEFEWYPDPGNAAHAKFYQKVTLTKDFLATAGFVFSEGSPNDVVLEIPTKQITKQIVVSNFEFVGSVDGSSVPKPKAAQQGGGIRIAGQTVVDGTNATSGTIAGQPETVAANAVPGSNDMPF